MPIGNKKTAAKPKTKKPVSRKPAKKTAKKKSVVKKTTSTQKAKKNVRKKKPAAKSVQSPKQSFPLKKTVTVEPGPPPDNIPPVEEPARLEAAIGVITHYYSHLSVAVIQINKGTLAVGNSIHIAGHITDFSQPVDSMEYEHKNISSAPAGQSVGIRVNNPVREHDIVYLIKQLP